MKKILLIEDNEDVSENAAEILGLAGYKVTTAPDGKAGVEIALKDPPDLIICDIMMPKLDGYGVLYALGKHQKTASIPFIFMTAKSEASDFRKGMGLGADDYITKPFEGMDLLNAVEARLKRAENTHKKSYNYTNGLAAFIHNARETSGVKLISEEREVKKYKKKQILYAEGQRPVAIYFVVSGKVLVRKSNHEMKELVTDICVAGDFIGYTALLEESNYKETAEFLEDTELMIIPRKDFLALINSNAEIARQFIKLLARNLAEKEEYLLNLAYNSLRKKVANGLLQVAGKYQVDGKDIVISRENLANVVGSATESLIRTLSDFKAEKLIDLQGNRIIILNEEKLKNLLG